MSFSSSELTATSRLHQIVGSTAFSRLAIHFCVRPFEWVHFRELKRRTGLANRSLQLQIARLLELGMINERRSARTVQYSANTSHQGWAALKAVLSAFATPMEVLSVALAGVEGIQSATLHAGSNTWGPVLDLLVVGNPPKELGLIVPLAGVLCGRRIRLHVAASAAEAPTLGEGVPVTSPGEED